MKVELRRALELLHEANNEIKNLRQHNREQAIRLKMFDDMMLVFNTKPKEMGVGHSPDLCHEIMRFSISTTGKYPSVRDKE